MIKGSRHTEESKKKIKDNHANVNGEKNSFYGKHHKEGTFNGKNNPMYGKHPSKKTLEKMSKSKIGNKNSTGQIAWNKGLTKETDFRVAKISKTISDKFLYDEKFILDWKERIKRMITKHPSKPQLKLFRIMKNRYHSYNIEIDWRVETRDGIRFIDVAIPELMLGFEYDEPYWHKNRVEADKKRHNAIEAEGWKLIHYTKISEFLDINYNDVCDKETKLDSPPVSS